MKEIARRLVGNVWQTGVVDEDTGGGALVSCLLARDASLDIQGVSTLRPILWDALYDNVWDFNPLTEIPAGLGLTFAFDGTDASITTTDDGAWSFATSVPLTADATFMAYYDLGLGRNVVLPGDLGGPTSLPILATDVVALTAGTTFTPAIVIEAQSTSNPYGTTPQLVIVRLG